jgi:hypothetical protein
MDTADASIPCYQSLTTPTPTAKHAPIATKSPRHIVTDYRETDVSLVIDYTETDTSSLTRVEPSHDAHNMSFPYPSTHSTHAAHAFPRNLVTIIIGLCVWWLVLGARKHLTAGIQKLVQGKSFLGVSIQEA